MGDSFGQAFYEFIAGRFAMANGVPVVPWAEVEPEAQLRWTDAGRRVRELGNKALLGLPLEGETRGAAPL